MRKLTAKEERFCQLIAQGKTQIEAYTTAYKNKMPRNQCDIEAHKILKKPKIALRVAELKERNLKKHDVTVQSILEELEEARVFAKDNKQSATLVSASLGKAKLTGLLVDKHVHSGDKESPILHKVEIIHVEPK